MRLLLLTTLLALLEWGQVRSEDDYHSELPQTLYAEPGCNATKVWIFQTAPMISKDYINKSKHFDELRDLFTRYNREMSTNSSTNTSCEEDLRWNSGNIDKYAANQTYEENQNFAKLYQINFPQLLPKNYNNTYYKFAHINYEHTEASLRAFTEGLFDKSTVPATEDMEYLTELLHPCEQFKKNYIQEEKDFVRYYDRTSKDIAERLE
ncbi:multiple inositol polyphosphate phosphatase 1-like [Drosophila albomicans]|uniref:Multiple inositol polyphosphate phosphatase 1-like n=1 Tax=Drosophila albomicans TaxID=7291 RepID=A0A6P8XD33_DROAB|nr:multiple inositol polyphosphate phosphatase 1-like [Drosophila albomicans]